MTLATALPQLLNQPDIAGKVWGEWGAPQDPLAMLCTALGLGLLIWALLRHAAPAALRARLPRGRSLAALCALVSGAFSAAYVLVYLRGGPRIIDATTYFFQARGLAAGQLQIDAGAPTEATRGRFLLFDSSHGTVTGIFPLGYPLILSLGFLAGAPMAVGPVLAALLTWMTYAVSIEVGRTLAPDTPSAHRRAAAELAALLAMVSGALRYHTADTMSHGTAALFILAATWALLRARRSDDPTYAAYAGAAVGYVFCTRFATGLGVLAWAFPLLVFWTRPSQRTVSRRGVAVHLTRRWSLVAFTLALLPMLALLMVTEHAKTGTWSFAQNVYYARSDGPVGCFRYGFGAGIGCEFEHGDFASAHLRPAGLTLEAATQVTLRRLVAHRGDALNSGLLWLVALGCWLTVRKGVRGRLALLWVPAVLNLLAYVPFYFDGNYPGGGARFFTDTLPLELVFAGFALSLRARLSRRALARWLPSAGQRRLPFEAATRFGLAFAGLSALAFGVHASFEHRQLRDREAGRSWLPEANEIPRRVPSGALVFVATDDAFNLAHAPGSLAASPLTPAGSPGTSQTPRTEPDIAGAAPRDAQAVRFARYRGDDFDLDLWHATRRPHAFIWRTDRGGELDEYLPERAGHYRAKNLWPALAQRHAYAIPFWGDAGCAGGQVLHVVADTSDGYVALALPVPHTRDAHVPGASARNESGDSLPEPQDPGADTPEPDAKPTRTSTTVAATDDEEGSALPVTLHVVLPKADSRGEFWLGLGETDTKGPPREMSTAEPPQRAELELVRDGGPRVRRLRGGRVRYDAESPRCFDVILDAAPSTARDTRATRTLWVRGNVDLARVYLGLDAQRAQEVP